MGKDLLGIFDAQERHFDLKNFYKEAENVKIFSKSQNFLNFFFIFCLSFDQLFIFIKKGPRVYKNITVPSEWVTTF